MSSSVKSHSLRVMLYIGATLLIYVKEKFSEEDYMMFATENKYKN